MGHDMGQFRLNGEILKTLRVLVDIESQFLDELLGDIRKNVDPCLSIEDEISSAVSKIRGPGDTEYSNRFVIAESIVGLHFLKQNSRMRVGEFLREILNSINDLDESIEKKYLTDNKNILNENLSRILLLEVLSTSTKSVRLLQASEKVFLKSSVITEIRPVFHDEVDDIITGSLVIHELKISYRDCSGINDIYLNLDAVDVRELKGTLDRALLKAETVEKIIRNNMTSFGSLIEVDSDG